MIKILKKLWSLLLYEQTACYSGKDLIKALIKQGYYIRGQTGSHVHLRHPIKPAVTIPNHPTISKGTLKSIIKELGITREEFMALLE